MPSWSPSTDDEVKISYPNPQSWLRAESQSKLRAVRPGAWASSCYIEIPSVVLFLRLGMWDLLGKLFVHQKSQSGSPTMHTHKKQTTSFLPKIKIYKALNNCVFFLIKNIKIYSSQQRDSRNYSELWHWLLEQYIERNGPREAQKQLAHRSQIVQMRLFSPSFSEYENSLMVIFSLSERKLYLKAPKNLSSFYCS